MLQSTLQVTCILTAKREFPFVFVRTAADRLVVTVFYGQTALKVDRLQHDPVISLQEWERRMKGNGTKITVHERNG